MLGRQAPLPKHHPGWHVHFLSRDEKTTERVLFPDTLEDLAAASHIAPVFTCSPPTLENVQFCQVSRSKIHRKQVQGVVVIVFKEAFWKKKSLIKKNQKQFLEDWRGKSRQKENVFLHLWLGQFYQSRWRQAQGCGTQLECQNAMETSSTGSRLWTSQKSCCWCCGTIVGFTLLENEQHSDIRWADTLMLIMIL